jgi:Flp pilus assembly pilin Flp
VRPAAAVAVLKRVVHNPRVDRAGAQRGATAVAYAVMVAILALLLVGGIFVLSDSVKSAFTGGAECVASPGTCEDGGGGGGGSGGGGGGEGGTSSSTDSTGPASTTTSTTTTTTAP